MDDITTAIVSFLVSQLNNSLRDLSEFVGRLLDIS